MDPFITLLIVLLIGGGLGLIASAFERAPSTIKIPGFEPINRTNPVLRQRVALVGVLLLFLGGVLLVASPTGADETDSSLTTRELALLADDVEPSVDKSLSERTGDLLNTESDYPMVPEDSTFDETLYILKDPDGNTLVKIKLGKGGIKGRFLLITPEGVDKTPIYLDLRGPFISGGQGSGGQGVKVIIRF